MTSNVWKLRASQGQKGCLWLAGAAWRVTKIQIFSFRKEKCSSVWSYDKYISTFWQKLTFNWSAKTWGAIAHLSHPYPTSLNVSIRFHSSWKNIAFGTKEKKRIVVLKHFYPNSLFKKYHNTTKAVEGLDTV